MNMDSHAILPEEMILRALIIEDQRIWREGISEHLPQHGIDVSRFEYAEDHEAAERLLEKGERYDLIISDQNTELSSQGSDSAGMEWIRKKKSQGLSTPIILHDRKIPKEAEAIADYTATKEISMESLANTIKQIFADSKG